LIYDNFYKSEDFKIFKESIIKIGIKFFYIFKNLFYNIKEVKNNDRVDKRLIFKPEISLKINNIIINEKISTYKYLIPLIEKPIE
jgi:hypothetical protein